MPSQPPPLLFNRYPRLFHQNSSLLETHFSLPAPAHTDDAVETPHPTKSAVLSTPYCDRVTSCPTFPLELTLSATPRVKRELPARAPVRLQLPSNFPPPLKTPQFPSPLRSSPLEEALTRAHLPDAPRLAATILGGGTDPVPTPQRTSPRVSPVLPTSAGGHLGRNSLSRPTFPTFLASRQSST